MNTTNLITDYIISGILGILTCLLPLLMVDHAALNFLFFSEIKNETILAVAVTVIGYAFGVVFNQIADYIEDLFYKTFKITVVQDAEDDLKTKCNFNHHYALQLVVSKSQSAYDYISFRRTMIRIIRSLMCLFILVPILHLMYIIFYRINGHTLHFSLSNLFLLLICILLVYISYRMLKKIYKGYYAAITNFALIIKEDRDNGVF